MATKMFVCLLVAFVLLTVFSPEADAFANGAGQGRKRLFQEKNSLPVSKVNLKIAFSFLRLLLAFIFTFTIGHFYFNCLSRISIRTACM